MLFCDVPLRIQRHSRHSRRRHDRYNNIQRLQKEFRHAREERIQGKTEHYGQSSNKAYKEIPYRTGVQIAASRTG